ncbi:MAG: hypothetical protein ACRDOM_05010 [Nocardioides sp.]
MAVILSTSSSSAPPRSSVNALDVEFPTLVCAASAGVHGALVVPHAHESPALGVAFAVAALALAAAAVSQAVFISQAARVAVPALLLMVAGAYLLSRTTGIPALTVHPEPFDALGAAISSLEVAAAVVMLRPPTRRSPT